MKKIGKNSKKGFTLVELIVVLVILAIMAAMLVPALTGYIKKAREEKDYQAASQALVAAQSLATQYYGKTANPTPAGAQSEITVGNVNDLIGANTVTGVSNIQIGSDYTVTGITFTINSSNYTYVRAADGSSTWTAAAATT